MRLFDHADFDRHESIHHFSDPATGLRAIIAIHSTALGPAAGGCRRWRYAAEADALTDALRLSRGMTYKNAVAGLPFGGGKAVILANDGAPKTPELFAAFGRAVESLAGRYVTAEDVGVSVDLMRHVARETRYVSGLPQSGSSAGGDPSPWTALGVHLGICAAVQARLARNTLDGVGIAVQGVGNVGFRLCRMLHEAGARLVVADVNPDNVDRVRGALPVRVVPPSDVLFADVDVLAPCALGNVLTAETIPGIRARVVAGSANNQLGTPADGSRLAERGILYAPDYVINAGGIISVAREFLGGSGRNQVRVEVGHIPERLRAIFTEARAAGRATHEVADALARRIVAGGGAVAQESAASARRVAST
jgi:leucine dehydrogenase